MYNYCFRHIQIVSDISKIGSGNFSAVDFLSVDFLQDDSRSLSL